MRIIFTIVALFILISCKEPAQENQISEDRIVQDLVENSDLIKLNIISEVKVSEIDVKEGISINLIFNKNTVVSPTHQKIYLSYLLASTKELQKFHTITFTYNIEKEEFNKNTFFISEVTKESILKKYEYIPLRDFVKFCLQNFNSETIFEFDIWIQNIGFIYPKELLKTNFWDLIEKFSYECSDADKSKEAKATIVVLYVAIKDYNEKSEQDNPLLISHKYNQKLLEELWKKCNNGEMIQFAEQRLFGKVGGNWNPNSY